MIGVAIADRRSLVRASIREILAEGSDLSLVAEASSLDDLVGILDAQKAPDVLVLDLSATRGGMIPGLDRLRTDHPDAAVIVTGIDARRHLLHRCFRHGARGALFRSASPAEFVQAVRRVAGGSRYEPAEVIGSVEPGDGSAPHESLSEREAQVLELTGQGLANAEIAERLGLSPRTVSTYRSRIRGKLEVDDLADALRYAMDNGLSQTSEPTSGS